MNSGRWTGLGLALAALAAVPALADANDVWLTTKATIALLTLKTSDVAIRDGVEAALKSDPGADGVNVASVNHGVVLLSGKAGTLAGKLRAIELAWSVGGVSHVASEIETRNK